MAYIDKEILERYISPEELIKLTDDGNTGVLDEANLDEAINAACDEFNNYARDIYDQTRFSDPLPEMLQQLISDIAIYNLYKRRYRLNMPESVTEIYRMALDKLEKIAKGLLQIDLPKKTAAGFIKTNKTESDKIFGKDTLGGL